MGVIPNTLRHKLDTVRWQISVVVTWPSLIAWCLAMAIMITVLPRREATRMVHLQVKTRKVLTLLQSPKRVRLFSGNISL